MEFTDIRSEDYGELQRVVDAVFAASSDGRSTKLDLELMAEINDLCDDLREVVGLLPSGSYRRDAMCDQLNSIICGHGWGSVYGTVE